MGWLLVMVSTSGKAQNTLPIGQWRSHLPYRIGQSVTQSDDRVYYATNWSVLSLDKEESSVDFLTTVEGLSNTGIALIKYNRPGNTLLVVYENSVIDLVRDDGISSLNQIRNFNSTGDKTIFDIFVENDSIVYLGAGYGVSRFNIAAREFQFTTFTGIPVRQVLVHDGRIYAATEEGIYTIDRNAINPEDFGAWRWLGPEEGFPGDYSSGSMTVFNDRVYAEINDSLFRFEASGPVLVRHDEGAAIEYITAEGEHLLVHFRCEGPPCQSSSLRFFTADGNTGRYSASCLGDSKYAIEDERGAIWFADGFRFFRSLDGIGDGDCNLTVYNSPFSERSREITVHDDQVWLATGGVDLRFGNLFLDHGFASLIDGQWTIYNRETLEELKGKDPDDPNDDLLDIITVAVHPDNGKVYAGSYFEGMVELDGENATLYNEDNSTLQTAIGDPTRTRVSGLTFDEEGTLWVTNYLAPRPLSTLREDGVWQSFELSCRQTEIHQIDIDENDFKWIVINGGQAGIALFDEGAPADDSDDRCRVFSSSNSELPTNQTNCLAVDREGDVWVGTSEGVVIFECGGNAFDPNCRGTRRIVQQDGVNAYLLGTEDVQTIAVDGANRKWVGTRNGVFVLSPNGEEEVLRFTTGNSPLLDNFIIDIAVSPRTGEVFMGTNKGIISYQSDAVQGPRVLNTSNILVFPNPVRPDYQGPIAIRGLAENANVKITDLNGQLVFETQALGGQAIWDGRDYTGRRANSGVYLVFSTTNPRNVGFTGKPDAAIAKIVLLN